MNAKALILLLLVGFAGCATIARENELSNQLDPLIGQPKARVIDVMGPPTSTFSDAGYEIYTYIINYGARATTFRSMNSLTDQPIYTTHSRERYDKIICYFSNGVLSKWTCDVER